MKSSSFSMSDGRFWVSGAVGVVGGAVVAYLWLPSYFSGGGFGMVAFGYAVFMLAAGILGLVIGTVLMRPDASH